MNCPYCNKKLHMQGGQFVYAGRVVTHGFCMDKKCQAYGKAIRFYLEQDKL
jgi:hypothetical protein